MKINLSLENKQINPGVINLKQFTTGTDTLMFEMDSFMHETTDLSKMSAYAVCDMSGRIDEVKLTTSIVEDKLRITWHVTGYTTDVAGTITYQIVFKDIENEKAVLWTSHKAIIFVNSSIQADDHIAAKYPSILQQWEQRMVATDTNSQSNLEETKKQVELAQGEVKKAAEQARISKEQANISAEQAEESTKQAARSEKEAERAQDILGSINELLGYKPVDAIGMEVMQARGEYPLLNDRLDAIQALAEGAQLTINRETFTATANQKRYVLTKGTYTLGANCLTVVVNGITQPYEALVEIDETTFELAEGFLVEEGDLIDVTYILMSTIKNAETPKGAQMKVDKLERKINKTLESYATTEAVDDKFKTLETDVLPSFAKKDLSNVSESMLKNALAMVGLIKTFKLPMASWLNNKQSIAYPGLTEYSSVKLQYAEPQENITMCEECNVRLSMAANGSLEFMCDVIPTMDVVIDILYQGERDRYYAYSNGTWIEHVRGN